MLRLLLITALMLSGCTYSTNPIFTEKDNVFDEVFLGSWETEKDAMLFDMRKFEVTRWEPEEKSYRVVLRNETGEKQGTFQLFLSQIVRTKFLTCKFEKPNLEKASPDEPAAAYLTFAIDQLKDGELKTRHLRGDWLAMQVKSNPPVLKHEWHARTGDSEKKDLRLTASTPELRALVLSHLDKRDAWMPVTFKKIR